ncbi:DMT family transporter [Pedococcus sp. NPDC057267]|uniref:DMT family transporter n=1 Tax=Pedococcus sp. NPDC057267 TaxID=3346077 RepID=UPI0036453D05
MNYPLVVATALASTVFAAVSTALKHHSATALSSTPSGPARVRTGRFLASTLRHRWWLAALVADAVGFTLQGFALHLGAVSVVQPLLVTALLTSLVITHVSQRTPMSRREWGWGALLVASLVGFLVVSGASSPQLRPQAADRGPAAVCAALALLLAVACVLAARRGPARRRAPLLGIAVGTLYACTAVLIKATTEVWGNSGPVAMLSSWQLPVLVVTGVSGLLLAQLAFRAGPLHTSLPVIATVDPLLSVLLGVVVYDEQLRTGAGPVAAQVGLLAGLAVAAVALSRLNADQAEGASAAPGPAPTGS